MSAATGEISETSSVWPPEDVVCYITEELIISLSGQRHLSQITALDLHLRDGSLGKIRKIEELHKLINLRQLNLSYNAIVKVENMESLSNLVELNLAENAIRDISGLLCLSSLQRLNLSGNRLRRIPEDICQLSNLENLRLARNHLTILEDMEFLAPLKKLTELRVDENPFASDADNAETRAFILFCLSSLLSLDGALVSSAERTDANRARNVVMSSREHRAKEVTSWRGRSRHASGKDALPEPRALKLKGETTKDIPTEGSGKGKDVDTLTKLLAYKTNEAEAARAELAEVRAGRITGRSESQFSSHSDQTEKSRSSSRERKRSRSYDKKNGEDYSISDSESEGSVDDALHPRDKRRESGDLKPKSSNRPSDNVQKSPPGRSAQSPARATHREDRIASQKSTPESQPRSPGSSGTPRQEEVARRRIVELNERVERVTSLLLQAEEDKRGLEQEVDTYKKKLEFAETEIASLRQACRPEQGTTDVGADYKSADLDTLRREIYDHKQRDLSNRVEISHLKDQLSKYVTQTTDSMRVASTASEENSRLKLDCDAALREASTLRNELQSLRNENISLRENLTTSAYNLEDKATLEKDRSRANEIISRYKQDLQRAQQEIDTLNMDFSEAQRHLKSSRELVLRVTREKELLEERLTTTAHITHGQSTDQDGRTKELLAKCSELESSLAIALNEKERLLTKISHLTEQIESQPLGSESPTRITTPRTSDFYQFAQPRPTQRSDAKHVASYLDEPSSDYSERNNNSVDADIAGISARVRPVISRAVQHGQEFGRRSNGEDNGLSPVHLSAAEVVSALLLEEMRAAPTSLGGRGGARNRQSAGISPLEGLEEACTRAALRLVYTAMDIVNNGGVNPDQAAQISPLVALGDNTVLQSLIERTQRGARTAEDIEAQTEEKRRLQECVDELKQSLAALDKKRHEKDDIVKAVNAECESAKERARVTINELQNLADQMLADKGELESLAKSKTAVQKEIEGLNRKMGDVASLCQIESKNLSTVRARLSSARDETDKWELRSQETRLEADNEEKRLRETKTIAGDQIKLLQQEVGRLHGDIKAGRRALEDLEKIRRNLDEEILKRRNDADSQHSALSRELDDTLRKTSSLRSEQRNIQVEIDKIALQKRQYVEEVTNLEERKLAVADSLNSLEEQGKRRTDLIERQIAETEKKLKALRESVSTQHSEQVLALHVLDDLKAQCADLERIADSRRRAIEDEVSQAQQQAVVSIRAGRSAVAGVEQKKAELEALCSECRLAERRLEDTKRGARELEISAEAVKDSVKQLETDKMRIRSDITSLKREEEELRTQVQNLKLCADSESRACEETRRRLLLLSEEEAAMKDAENRLRASLALLKKNSDDAQVELEEFRSCSERERRLLSELRGKKNMSDSEASRAADELRFAHEQLGTLEKQQEEMRANYQKIKDEVMKQQKELASSQRRAAEALRVEDQMKRAEKEAMKKNEKLLAESDAITARLSIERAQLESIRNERDRCANELQITQESQAALAQEIASYNLNMESLKANYSNLDAARSGLLQEISQLRETARLEVSRIDRINDTYSGVEKRLAEVRENLIKTEGSYEKARAQSVEEERRVEHHRGLLRNAAADVRKMEDQLASANKALYEDRVKAISELNKLNSAKNSLQDHVIQLSDAQQRRQASNPEIVISPPSRTVSSPSTAVLGNKHILPSDRLRSLSHFTDVSSNNKDIPAWNSQQSSSKNEDSSDDNYSDGSFARGSVDDGSTSSSEHHVDNRNYTRFRSNQESATTWKRAEGPSHTTEGLAEEVRRLQEKSISILQNRSKENDRR